jgi:hypothetical protein
MNAIDSHIENILQNFTEGEYYDLLIKAKDIYIDLTGKMDEEASEYESRMNTFNDWFIFNFRRDDNRRVIDDYIQKFDIDPSLSKSFHNINYSVFQFVKINFRKQIILKDILHNEKFTLKAEDCKLGLLEDDIFVGRLISHEDKSYLLKGVCTLPREILSNLKKEAKRVRKLNSDTEEEKFLLKLEKLKTKSLHYGHINSEKIFIFK